MGKINQDNTDSALACALKFNKTNPIKYNEMWFPKGTLKKLLDSTPKPIKKEKL